MNFGKIYIKSALFLIQILLSFNFAYSQEYILEFKNTSESFVVTEMMAQSANDNSIMTQGLSLFNIYKSRSYTCKISAMGNVCIQPTMYFTLRNVPIKFYGDPIKQTVIMNDIVDFWYIFGHFFKF